MVRLVRVFEVVLVIWLVLLVAACSPYFIPYEPASIEVISAAVEAGDFYTEVVTDSLVYIYVERTYSPTVQMAYITEQLELLDSKYQIVDITLTIFEHWIWSPVVVVVREKEY